MDFQELCKRAFAVVNPRELSELAEAHAGDKARTLVAVAAPVAGAAFFAILIWMN